jgi:hypothetical protein
VSLMLTARVANLIKIKTPKEDGPDLSSVRLALFGRTVAG